MRIREIDELIEEGNSLKLVAQAYGEIASVKLKRIRSQVERNRLFFNEIAEIFKIVQKHALKRQTSLKKTKDTVSILITSNQRFYGGIDTDVIRYFIETTTKLLTDRIIIGTTGQSYLKTINYFHKYNIFDIENDIPDTNKLNELSQTIKDYKQILVFYPQISTVLIQKPVAVDITQSSISRQVLSKAESEKIPTDEQDYVIFEPELGKVLEFFDNQIISLLLEQTFFEAELARTASRLLSMDQAQVEANKFIDGQKRIKALIKRDQMNKEILESISSLTALGKNFVI